MSKLKQQVAIVTGCGNPNGIGRATAMALAKQGADVIVTDICRVDSALSIDGALKLGDDFTALRTLADQLTEIGGEAVAMALDLTDSEQIAQVVAETFAKFKRIDILINNAGTPVGTGPFLDISGRDWDLSAAINIRGTAQLCQQIIPIMQRQGGGAIVNNASIMGISAMAYYGAYAATKHGVVGLTKLIASEFAEQGIRCNAVCPGSIHTDMGEAEAQMLVALQGISYQQAMAQLSEEAAMNRMGKPEEVADLMTYLASPCSSFVTGAVIPVTGGMRPGL